MGLNPNPRVIARKGKEIEQTWKKENPSDSSQQAMGD